ncbi:hypothetical protein CHS0354_035069, partial [Potamilus streckersoni]
AYYQGLYHGMGTHLQSALHRNKGLLSRPLSWYGHTLNDSLPYITTWAFYQGLYHAMG